MEPRSPDRSQLIAKTKANAEKLKTAFDDHKAAIKRERDAEAKILELAIDIAKPALAAITDEIELHRKDWLDRSSPEEIRCHPTPGVLLVGDPSQARIGKGGLRGDLQAQVRLYLLATGELLQVSYSGTWSAQPEVPSIWSGVARPMTAREVMDDQDLDDLLETIIFRLNLSDGRTKATKAANARAERLEALVRLVT